MLPILLFVTAPYGRHATRKWGLTIPNREGWILMESPALLIFLYFTLNAGTMKNPASLIIVMLFAIHYINRSFIYPLRIRTQGKRMPLLIAALAIIFNMVNGYINGYYISSIQHKFTGAWLTDPRFIIGLMLFLAGMILNITADEKLIRMRKDRSDGYKIPYGQLFNLISCPNFFGEIIEWLGFAVLCWSLPALSFLVWTISNLLPRALDHHRWYKEKFRDYPSDRKALFPHLL
jgi:hypothetical protein